MKRIIIALALLLPALVQAQFSGSEKGGLTVIVTDGTIGGKNSPLRPPGDSRFQDPINPMGMVDAFQAAAFTEKPQYGKAGFILIFCVNDAIGGKQGTLNINGQTYKGIYRLIRQKHSPVEQLPKGMTTYRLSGTVFFLGIS